MSTPTTKNILVTGATGKQGGAVIQALLASDPSSHPIHIYALTRSLSSKPAQSLASTSHVTVIEGQLEHSSNIFSGIDPIHGVFSVQVNQPGSNVEEIQGKNLIDAAIAAGVKHFVYASGDRGGPERSEVNETKVKNFMYKFNIEKHLKQKAAESSQGMTYTILRPTTFFENHTTDMHGSGFARMWEQMGSEKKLQMVSTKDIGWFGAQALLNPEDPLYKNAAISLAGDELTQPEANAIFEEVMGKEMPLAPCLIIKGVKYFKNETLGDMFEFFEKEGYGADVGMCRKLRPGMLDYKAWLKENSGFQDA